MHWIELHEILSPQAAISNMDGIGGKPAWYSRTITEPYFCHLIDMLLQGLDFYHRRRNHRCGWHRVLLRYTRLSRLRSVPLRARAIVYYQSPTDG